MTLHCTMPLETATLIWSSFSLTSRQSEWSVFYLSHFQNNSKQNQQVDEIYLISGLTNGAKIRWHLYTMQRGMERLTRRPNPRRHGRRLRFWWSTARRRMGRTSTGSPCCVEKNLIKNCGEKLWRKMTNIRYGFTVLHHAVYRGNVLAVQRLIEGNEVRADIDQKP